MPAGNGSWRWAQKQKAAVERAIEDLIRQCERKLLKVHQIEGMRQHIARMAAPEELPGGAVTLLQKSLQHAGGQWELALGTKVLEDADEFLLAGAAQQHLVLNAPQECFVTQGRRVEVGGEDQENLEGNAHFAAGQKAEIVLAALHGHDPAIQDLTRDG